MSAAQSPADNMKESEVAKMTFNAHAGFNKLHCIKNNTLTSVSHI